MLLFLANLLAELDRFFRVFDYISLRAILATLTALVISLVLGPPVIKRLNQYNIGQQVRLDGPQDHLAKQGTPTMGGLLILLTITITTLLWGNLSNQYIWLILFTTIGFGVIGLIDDYKKLVLKNSKGLSAKAKYASQTILGLAVAFTMYYIATTPAQTSLLLPFFKNIMIPLGWFYIVFSYFVIVGTSNAVNLTDGLDGLAVVPAVLVTGALGIFAYLTGHIEFSNYLNIPYVKGAGELCVFCGALVGAGLGFLWFNTYPALVFMGDVGALSIGAAIGLLAVIVRQELVLFIMGGIFVLETVSVMLQVGSYKMTKKRVFKMAPIHHHFELIGWPEPRVIVRFWIITVILVLLGLSTLKLR